MGDVYNITTLSIYLKLNEGRGKKGKEMEKKGGAPQWKGKVECSIRKQCPTYQIIQSSLLNPVPL